MSEAVNASQPSQRPQRDSAVPLPLAVTPNVDAQGGQVGCRCVALQTELERFSPAGGQPVICAIPFDGNRMGDADELLPVAAVELKLREVSQKPRRDIIWSDGMKEKLGQVDARAPLLILELGTLGV
jgi:hypothetical protein